MARKFTRDDSPSSVESIKVESRATDPVRIQAASFNPSINTATATESRVAWRIRRALASLVITGTASRSSILRCRGYKPDGHAAGRADLARTRSAPAPDENPTSAADGESTTGRISR